MSSIRRNDPYTHFSQQPHNKLTWLVIFYYFFTKRKENKIKNNNKILPTTSTCCEIVVKNECRNHFSFDKISLFLVDIIFELFYINPDGGNVYMHLFDFGK
jgi:hypothetical protein